MGDGEKFEIEPLDFVFALARGIDLVSPFFEDIDGTRCYRPLRPLSRTAV